MDYNLQKNQNAEQTYHSIRNSIVSAQHRLSTAVNSAMVTTYWEIGEQIFKACGENDRAEYGKKLLEYLSEQLTAEFGKGFDKSNLRKMRQFYCTFPIRDTLCPELSWSHYRVLMRINDEQARRFYMEECAKAAWSVRQLERQINTMYYQRILASQDKIAVANEIQITEPKPEYEKIVKDPYVMEFLQIQVKDGDVAPRGIERQISRRRFNAVPARLPSCLPHPYPSDIRIPLQVLRGRKERSEPLHIYPDLQWHPESSGCSPSHIVRL